MHDTLFTRKWVDEETKLETEVLKNILVIKKLRKFQDRDEYWDLINSCWEYKNHVDKKQEAFKKRWSKIDILASIEKTIPIHEKKRKITNAFFKFASKLIDELEIASEDSQRKWLENASQIASKTRLNGVYKLWSDIYVWKDADIVQKIFTHMGVYNREKYSLEISIKSMCEITDSNSANIIKYLMNQFAKNNKELFTLNLNYENKS